MARRVTQRPRLRRTPRARELQRNRDARRAKDTGNERVTDQWGNRKPSMRRKLPRNSPSGHSLARRKREAIRWWKDLLNSHGKVTAKKILRTKKERFRPQPGQIVLLQYSAKWKKKLPYWDRYPLAVILDVDSKGWLAFNLHYLPIDLRWTLFKNIQERVQGKKGDVRRARARVSYAIFKTAGNLWWGKPCIKRHLYSHMRRRPVRIPWDEAAEYAVYLDLQQWMVKSQPSNIEKKVYRDSRKILEKAKKRRKNG